MEIVLRPSKGGDARENLTFADTGSPITGIRFELRPERAPVV
jgi:hypothetical protein